jgi:hypothetical protein
VNFNSEHFEIMKHFIAFYNVISVTDQDETKIKFAKLIVAKFPSKSVVSVRDSQNAFSDTKVTFSIAYSRSSFSWLPDRIEHLENLELPL